MYDYEDGGLRDADKEEKIVEEIRAAALRKVQLTYPDIEYVVDHRTIDDYCYKEWEYPGAWYSKGFKLPDGFRSKEELIDAIAADTIRYFIKKNK